MAGRLAYLMSRFPHLPETFILREMNELERQGWQIDLFPLISQSQPVMHAEAAQWIERAHRVPFFSSEGLAANAQALLRAPRPVARLVARTLWENRSSFNYLVRAVALFPKAVQMARLMQQRGVQHIHAHYASHPALAAWIIHRLTGISFSVTVHAHDIFVRRAMLATKLRDAAFIVAISEFNREFLAREVGPWVRATCHVVHCGIEPERYAPRAALPAPRARFEILSIGSLQPYKGQRFLLDACALLAQQGVDFRCRIIGGGEERAALERQIAALGLGEQVFLLGAQPQDEVARLLPSAHCYVQPSIVTPSGKMEGIPVALMEALACSLPVVATAISGIPELVRAEQTGLLVPPADPAALAQALLALRDDPSRAARLGEAGRALVLAEWELRANVARLAALFERVTAA